jgi:hypothetical protein
MNLSMKLKNFNNEIIDVASLKLYIKELIPKTYQLLKYIYCLEMPP